MSFRRTAILKKCRDQDKKPGRKYPVSEQEYCLWDTEEKKILMAGPKAAVKKQEKAVQYYKRQGAPVPECTEMQQASTIRYKGASYVALRAGRRLVTAQGPSERVKEELRIMSPELRGDLDELVRELGIPAWRIVMDAQDRGMSVFKEIQELRGDPESASELKQLVELEQGYIQEHGVEKEYEGVEWEPKVPKKTAPPVPAIELVSPEEQRELGPAKDVIKERIEERARKRRRRQPEKLAPAKDVIKQRIEERKERSQQKQFQRKEKKLSPQRELVKTVEVVDLPYEVEERFSEKARREKLRREIMALESRLDFKNLFPKELTEDDIEFALPYYRKLKQKHNEGGKRRANVVKYKGAYYTPVEALKQEVDPSKRLPQQQGINEFVSTQIHMHRLDTALQNAEKVFDTLVASPGLEKYDDKRQQIDAQLSEVRRNVEVVKSLTQCMGDTIEAQQETIGRFQDALQQLQEQRTSSAQGTSGMATQEETPQMVKYAGHFYVLAEDEDKEPEEVEELEEEVEEHLEEEAEEMELLDALKSHWQTILDKLPDDLEVDDEFEAALNGIDEVISVMDKIHAEYAEEPPGEEEGLPEEPEAE